MADANKVAIELALENRKYLQEIKKSQEAISKFSDKASSGMKMLGNVMSALPIIGLIAAFQKLITTTDAQEKAEIQLNAILKSTKFAAGMTADELINLSKNLASVTTFSDQAILSAENMLLTFTNIGQKVFPQATEAILNMSVVMGTDLKSQAIQLGKALNDPIAGASALKEVGVAFTNQQIEQIAVMQKSGNILGAQKIILNELNTEFGGLARASRDTVGGSFTVLGNKFTDLMEKFGTQLEPAIKGLLIAFSDATDSSGVFGKALMVLTVPANLVIKSIANIVMALQRLSLAGDIGKLDERMEKLGESMKKAAAGGNTERVAAYKQKLIDLWNEKKKLQQQDWDMGDQIEKNAKNAFGLYDTEMKKLQDKNKQLKENKYTYVQTAQEQKKYQQEQIALLNFLGEEEKAQLEQLQLEKMEMIKLHKEQEVAITVAAEQKKQDIYRLTKEKQIGYGMTILGTIGGFVGQLGALQNQASQNRIANIDLEQQKEVEAINKSSMSEEQKQAAIAKINESYELKKRAEQRRAAVKAKDFAIAETLLSIPQAAFAAFTGLAKINIVAAGIAAAAATALGIAKLRMIQQQPLPAMATGAFNVPRDMTALIHQGETVIPKTMTESIQRGDVSLGSGSGGDTFIFNGAILDEGKLLSIIDSQRQKKAARMGTRDYRPASVY